MGQQIFIEITQFLMRLPWIRFKNLIWFKVNSGLNLTGFKNLSGLLNAKKLTNYFFMNLTTCVLLSKSTHFKE